MKQSDTFSVYVYFSQWRFWLIFLLLILVTLLDTLFLSSYGLSSKFLNLPGLLWLIGRLALILILVRYCQCISYVGFLNYIQPKPWIIINDEGLLVHRQHLLTSKIEPIFLEWITIKEIEVRHGPSYKWLKIELINSSCKIFIDCQFLKISMEELEALINQRLQASEQN